MIEAPPILEDENGPTAEKGLGMQHPQFWPLEQLFEHAGHGERHGHPLMKQEEAIHPHADEENHKIAVYIGGVTSLVNMHQRRYANLLNEQLRHKVDQVIAPVTPDMALF